VEVVFKYRLWSEVPPIPTSKASESNLSFVDVTARVVLAGKELSTDVCEESKPNCEGLSL
jgi:hypothetical protein